MRISDNIHSLPETGQVLRNAVALFHSCVGHEGTSPELLLHPRHFGWVPNTEMHVKIEEVYTALSITE